MEEKAILAMREMKAKGIPVESFEYMGSMGYFGSSIHLRCCQKSGGITNHYSGQERLAAKFNRWAATSRGRFYERNRRFYTARKPMSFG